MHFAESEKHAQVGNKWLLLRTHIMPLFKQYFFLTRECVPYGMRHTCASLLLLFSVRSSLSLLNADGIAFDPSGYLSKNKDNICFSTHSHAGEFVSIPLKIELQCLLMTVSRYQSVLQFHAHQSCRFHLICFFLLQSFEVTEHNSHGTSSLLLLYTIQCKQMLPELICEK